MKSILPLVILLVVTGACKKDKEKNKDFSGQFLIKTSFVIGAAPQYLVLGSSGYIGVSDRKYIWEIEKAIDDKYYIISADMPGRVLGINSAGAIAFVNKGPQPDDNQLFYFKTGGSNDNMFYIVLVGNPNKFITIETPVGNVYYLSKDLPCTTGPGQNHCFLYKFSLEQP